MGRSTDEAAAPVIASMLHSEQLIESIGKRGATEFAETRSRWDQFCYFSRCLDSTKPSKEECQDMRSLISLVRLSMALWTLWLKAEEQKRVIHWQTSFYALDPLRTHLSL